MVDAWGCSVNIDTAFEKVTGFGGKVEANSQIDAFVEVTEVVFGAGRAQGSWFDLDRSPRLKELDEWRRMGLGRPTCRGSLAWSPVSFDIA